MEKIIVSCDTTISLTKEEIEKRGLYVIPLNAIADGVEYHDTVDIDALKLCKLMRGGAVISTSTPTPVEIKNYFDDVFAKTNADKIIHFTISSRLSSMFDLFTNFCKQEYGDKVIVVDSLSICCWMEQQVMYAKYLVDKGNDANTVVEKVINELRGTEECFFIPESLEFLKRGGRISAATAAIANVVGFLPVLTFSNGVVGKKGVTRTALKTFLQALDTWISTYPNFKDDYKVVIVENDTTTSERNDRIKNIILEETKELGIETIDKILSLNVTAHTGPGTFGIGIIKKVKTYLF